MATIIFAFHNHFSTIHKLTEWKWAVVSAVPAVQGVVALDPDGALRHEPAGDPVLERDAVPLHAAHPLADQLPGAGRVARNHNVALGHVLVVELETKVHTKVRNGAFS